MIDFENIELHLIQLISDLIGSELNTIPSQSGTKPAVFQARQTVTPPDEPYITIDLISFSNANSLLDDIYMDKDENNIYSTQKELVYRITGYAPEALPILQKLDSKIRFRSSQEFLVDNANTTILRWNTPQPFNRIMADQTRQHAFMDMFLGVWDSEINTFENSSIQGVEGEGTIIDGEDNKVVSFNIDQN